MDVARLRYEIDSSQTKTAEKNLGNMTRAAKDAERGQKGLANTTTRAGRDVAGANDNVAQSTNRLRDSKGRFIKASKDGIASNNLFTTSLGKLRLGVLGAVAAVGVFVTTLVVGFARAIANGTREALGFSRAITEVATLSQNAQENTGALALAATDLSNAYGGTATAQVQGFYQAISAGAGTVAQATQLLVSANKLAVAGVTDVATGVDVLTTATNAYGLANLSAAQASDALFVGVQQGKTTIPELSRSLGQVIPIASSLGVNFDELVGSIAALTTQGQSTSLAITGVRGILSTIAAPTTEAAKLARQLGIEFNTTALASKGLNGFLTDVVERTGGSKEALAQLFGSVEALNAVLAFSGGAGQKFNDIQVEMASKVGATDAAFNTVSNSLSGRYDRAVSQISNSFLQIGERILPLVVTALELFGRAMQAASNAIVDAIDRGVAQFQFMRDVVSAVFTNIPSAISVGIIATLNVVITTVERGINKIIGVVNNGVMAINALGGDIDLVPTFNTNDNNLNGLTDALGGLAGEGAQAYQRAFETRDAALAKIIERRNALGVVEAEIVEGLTQAPTAPLGTLPITPPSLDGIGVSRTGTTTQAAENLADQRARNAAFISDLREEVGILGQARAERESNLIILEREREIRAAIAGLGANATIAETQAVRQLITQRQTLNDTIDRQAAALEGVRDLAGDFVSSFRSGLEQTGNLFESVGRGALSVLDKITDRLLNDVLDALFQVGGASSGGGGLLGGIGSVFAGFFANGGDIPRGQFGIAGEAGAELLTRPTAVAGPARITPISASNNNNTGNQQIVVSFTSETNINGGNEAELQRELDRRDSVIRSEVPSLLQDAMKRGSLR